MFERCRVCVRGQWWREDFSQQGHPGTQRPRLDSQDAALQRDTGSEVSLGSFGGSVRACVCVSEMEGAPALVVPSSYTSTDVRACVCLRALDRVTCNTEMDPSGQAFSGQVPVDTRRKRERDDDEGR